MQRLLIFLLVCGIASSLARAQDAQQSGPAVTLVAGRMLSDSLAATDRRVYAIELAEHHFVSGVVDQRTVDVVVTIIGPDGAHLGEFDGPGRGPEPFHFETKTAGNYRIEVTPFERQQGRYTIVLKRAEPVAVTPEKRVDQLMADYDGEAMPGGVIGVVRNGMMVFSKGYGMANLEYGIPNTPGSIYQVASVSKQFTAFAIALLEEQGKLSLDDDIRKYIPELPDLGNTITLRNLLNHTSGLRELLDLWEIGGSRIDDVIKQSDLFNLTVRQHETDFAPGTEFSYNNTGYLLLSEVVARVTGSRFGEWMRVNVFEPLDMHSTQIYDDYERVVKGQAYSYQIDVEGIKKLVLNSAITGATGVITTVEDLAKWQRNFHTAEIGGPRILQRMQERAVLATDDTLEYALGLIINTHRGLHQLRHNGVIAGYRTALTYFPGIDAGVIVLCNLASIDAPALANDVADAFFEGFMLPIESTPTAQQKSSIALASDRLDAYAGTYRIDDRTRLTVMHETDHLTIQVEGQPRSSLRALSDTLFHIEHPYFTTSIGFHVEAGGQVEHGMFYQNGAHAVRRVKLWQPSLDEQKLYTGRYYSPELETFYTIAVKDSMLVAHHWRHGDIMLVPEEKDTFTGSVFFFRNARFEVDQHGVVNGMRVSGLRARNVYFQKQ